MINDITICNFKCFKKMTTIPMGALTVCTGMNSVGKSSLIQALLIIKQVFDRFNPILLNNSALNLGSTDQIMDKGKDIYLSFNDIELYFKAGKDKLSLVLTPKSSKMRQALEYYHNILKDNAFYYLNAERYGPRNYQGMISQKNLHCGHHGEYTFDMISKIENDETREKRRFIFDENKKVPTFAKQIEYWLGYIVNGVEVNFSSDLTTQLAQMKVSQSAMDTGFGSPYNFGFGISYALPIITTGLYIPSESLLLVENPEAHLHPAGQSRMGEFLAHIGSDNVQVVIETHSEHIINGIRKYALKKRIDPNSICIDYFSISESQEHKVQRLPLNEKMDILEWPHGFFDQEEIDLSDLRHLRNEIKKGEL